MSTRAKNPFLISINIGQERTIQYAKASGKTGIFKQPVSGPVQITYTGLPGDVICDTENHGGVDQAVYVYTTPDYAWWSQELGHELVPGTFGENLTITGLESTQLCIGDRLQVGEVVLEVTSPRIPCVTLATRMGDPAFVKRFRAAERPGLYCRVIQNGFVQQNDPVSLSPYWGERIPVVELFRFFYGREKDEATLRRHLAAPIAIRDRIEKEQQLAKLLEDQSGGRKHPTIVVYDYNPSWPAQFEAIRSALQQILGPLALRIDHIGSTSVPGLGAKDVIDIQVTVQELVPEIVQKLLAAGYSYRPDVTQDHVPPGEDPDPRLWSKIYFQQPERQRRMHIHIRKAGNPNQRYALLFRDYLRAHPLSASVVELIKRQLARYHADDVIAYYDIKDPVYDLIWDAAQDWARLTGWK